VIEAAAAVAGELLRREVGADDQAKMAERYVVELEQTPSARPPRGES
jgi:hypothetical protein